MICLYNGNSCDSSRICQECSVEHEYWDRCSRECYFLWLRFSDTQPTEASEYLVIIKGAELATVLTWNGDVFVDDLNDPYVVEYWAPMPVHPKEVTK